MATPGTQISLLPLLATITGNESIPCSITGNSYRILSKSLGFIGQTPAELALGIVPSNVAYLEGEAMRYGADNTGVNDSYGAFQTAFNIIAQEGHGIAKAGSGGVYKWSAAPTLDVSTTGFDGQGCHINATAITTGNLLNLTQSSTDLKARPQLAASHPIKHFTIQGPGIQNTTAVGLNFNDTGLNEIAGVVVAFVGFQDIGQDVIFNNGAYDISFIHCQFGPTTAGSSAAATTYSVVNLNGTSSGYRNTFIDCVWAGKAKVANQSAGSPSCELQFVSCSLNGFNVALNSAGGGLILATSCRLSSGTDSANWVFASGGGSGISLSECVFNLTAAKGSYDLCWSDPSCVINGITLINCKYESTFTMTTHIVGGSGPARVRDMQTVYGSPPIIGPSQNLLAFGGFESAQWTNDTFWNGANQVYGATLPAQSTDFAHSGTHSLKFVAGTTGTNPQVYWTRACRPGQQVTAELWYLAQTLTGTGSTLQISTNYIDAGGDTLAYTNTNISASGASGVFVYNNASMPSPAPAGTVAVELFVELLNTTSGTATAYIDDLIINVS